MNLTTFIIDDEAHALTVLSTFIQRTPGLILSGAETNPLVALQEIGVSLTPPDLIFADIDMPELNGLELAGILGSKSTMVFTTAFREYGPEAYALSAADYLLKPIGYDRFLSCIQKVRLLKRTQLLPLAPEVHFFVKSGNKGHLHKIIPAEVVYIEAALNYMHINSATEKISTHMNITEIQALLPTNQFVRVHKSFIVNIYRIKSFDQAIIKMDDQSAIPLGRAFRTSFLAIIQRTGAVKD